MFTKILILLHATQLDARGITIRVHSDRCRGRSQGVRGRRLGQTQALGCSRTPPLLQDKPSALKTVTLYAGIMCHSEVVTVYPSSHNTSHYTNDFHKLL